jgi:hypothetical protein
VLQAHAPIRKGVLLPPVIAKTQMQMFRIFQMLHSDSDVDLYYPEGGIFGETYDHPEEMRKHGERIGLVNMLKTVSDGELARLLDGSIDIDSVLAFCTAYETAYEGVEDSDVYESGIANFDVSIKSGGTEGKTEEDYFNHLRSAHILLNAPVVAGSLYEDGMIKNRNAALAIGLFHQDEMLSWVRDDHISLEGIGVVGDEGADKHRSGMDRSLGYQDMGYGVTFILPKALDIPREELLKPFAAE